MGDLLTIAQFHYFVRQQPQSPASMPFGSLAAGQSRNQSSLFAIDEGRTTGLLLVVQTLQPALLIGIDESDYGRIAQSHAILHGGYRFATCLQHGG